MGIGRFVEYKETRPLSFSREVRGNIIAGHLILLPSLGVKQSVFIKELDSHM